MTGPARQFRLAWSLFAATIALLGVQTYFVLASRTPLRSEELGLNSFPIITLGAALGALVGALVASRHPGNRVGWLFCVGQLGTAVGLAADAFGTAVQFHGQPEPGWMLEPAVVLSVSMGAIWALTLVSAIFLIVPDGRLPSRRWRPVAWALPVPLVVSSAVLVAFASTHRLEMNQDESNVAWYFVLSLAGSWLLLALTLGATTTSLVLRLRRSQGVVRQQLRWIAAAATALLIGTVIAVVGGEAAADQSWGWVTIVPLYLGYVSVPVAAGVAVLKYRLYDIDVVISRAALLALLLAFVTCGYAVAVVTLGGLLGDRVGASFLVSLLATAAVALAFQPLRSWAVRVADRVAYGPRAVPYEALADLSRRLGESPDPATLLPAVADAAAHAVGATRATVVLPVAAGSDQTATWPATGDEPARVDAAQTPAVEVPVTDHGEKLGTITVQMPAGRALRGHDTRLLVDLADQAAIAFRNAGLSAELAGRVELLRLRTLELLASRRRLITTGDAERRRLERAIGRDVVPHLEPLPSALTSLARGWRSGDAARLDPLVAGSTAALEALREITRGVFPAQLARGGLGPALASYLGRAESKGHLTVDASAADRRFDPRAEAAAYFCVTEAAAGLQPPFEVELAAPDGRLVLQVRGRAHGDLAMAHIHDRVEAAGGTVRQELRGDCLLLDVRLPVSAPGTPGAPRWPGAPRAPGSPPQSRLAAEPS
jgi:signal transduction histidine kinase